MAATMYDSSYDPYYRYEWLERIRYEERQRYEERLQCEREWYLMEVATSSARVIIEDNEDCQSCKTSHKRTKLDEQGRCEVKQKQHLANIHKVASARGSHS